MIYLSEVWTRWSRSWSICRRCELDDLDHDLSVRAEELDDLDHDLSVGGEELDDLHHDLSVGGVKWSDWARKRNPCGSTSHCVRATRRPISLRTGCQNGRKRQHGRLFRCQHARWLRTTLGAAGGVRSHQVTMQTESLSWSVRIAVRRVNFIVYKDKA